MFNAICNVIRCFVAIVIILVVMSVLNSCMAMNLWRASKAQATENSQQVSEEYQAELDYNSQSNQYPEQMINYAK